MIFCLKYCQLIYPAVISCQQMREDILMRAKPCNIFVILFSKLQFHTDHFGPFLVRVLVSLNRELFHCCREFKISPDTKINDVNISAQNLTLKYNVLGFS